ncbi:MAG TPA: histidinol-phosphate transaminase, partial [Vicinamibacteria bacterium]|nr:histidinol-phosphate transaminase [Vicinamibacteria bacterium]
LSSVKRAVRSLSAYTLAAREAPVKLNQNESPYDLPEPVKRRVMEEALARPWSRYPAFDPQELTAALARFAGWSAEGVLAGNGSNELIQALFMVTVGPGTRVVIPEPTFSLYALLARILGGDVVPAPLGPELEYQAAVVAEMARELAPVLTVICSPNNPTGSALDPEAVAAVCAAAPGLVVVDEAYHEFSGRTVVPLLEGHPNLVVLRTFSKAMAMAGLRVGYLLADPALVREIGKAKLPYNLNVLSQAAALAALAEPAALRERVQRVVAARQELFRRLAHVAGVRPFPSQANFILFELESADPRAVFESLWQRGVLVRDVSAYPRLARCLRVTVGSDEENETFLTALRHALSEQRFKKER